MDRFFKRARDLGDSKIFSNDVNDESEYFHIAGDLSNDNKNKDVETFPSDISVEEINKYLKTIVSGIEYDIECELGILCSAGSCIVSFEDLKKMIEEGGYNFISAECFNKEMISIRYQQYSKEYSRKF